MTQRKAVARATAVFVAVSVSAVVWGLTLVLPIQAVTLAATVSAAVSLATLLGVYARRVRWWESQVGAVMVGLALSLSVAVSAGLIRRAAEWADLTLHPAARDVLLAVAARADAVAWVLIALVTAGWLIVLRRLQREP